VTATKTGQHRLPPTLAVDPSPQREPLPTPCRGPSCSQLPRQDAPIPTAPLRTIGHDPACLAATFPAAGSGSAPFVLDLDVSPPACVVSPLERPPRAVAPQPV
jgi:hypothetical protein